MDSKEKELSLYRLENAISTLEIAKLCMEKKHYRDSINRCYYAAFYAVKSVLALEQMEATESIVNNVIDYLRKENVLKD